MLPKPILLQQIGTQIPLRVGNYPHIIPRLLQFTPEMPLLSQDTDICLNVLEIKTPFVIVRSVGCFSEFVR
ncbi:hypothetical protein SAMN02745132_04426 [Enterovibrio nigricans DSM 22720]|uniref:Uncharacterized protein n=1 Tax=Enterovibrio nigricans DSM 22720 TaxID=1121868 RepID=A0A1T4VW51_9GAMM|nr:hypothetical protein SAMN02745132_04426 [Enterovibrio nigricans DSM 22720]